LEQSNKNKFGIWQNLGEVEQDGAKRKVEPSAGRGRVEIRWENEEIAQRRGC